MKKIISAIKETSETFPKGFVNNITQDDGITVELDGDFDDYEFFMIELSENLPKDVGFENTIENDRCYIKIEGDD